jgi:hypothetical protein
MFFQCSKLKLNLLLVFALAITNHCIAAANPTCDDSFQIAPFNNELFIKAKQPHELTPITGYHNSFLFNGRTVHKIEARGGLNAGLFTYSENGVSKIIKTFRVMDPKHHLFDLQRGFLEGALLGSLVGGPKIYDYGFMKLQNGLLNFYIKMERLFPDEAFYTTKGYYTRDSDTAKLLVEKPVLRKAADFYLKALERGIAIEDVDIAVSASGKVRWIDCDFWRLQDLETFNVRSNFKSFSNWIRGPEINYLKDYLKEKVQNSRDLSPSLKTELLSYL